MTLDINVLTEQAARAQMAVCDTEPDGWAVISPNARGGWLRETAAALAVIVPAVTAEVRALHKEASRVTYWRDALGDDHREQLTHCALCGDDYPCPTVRLLDQLDKAARGERS